MRVSCPAFVVRGANDSSLDKCLCCCAREDGYSTHLRDAPRVDEVGGAGRVELVVGELAENPVVARHAYRPTNRTRDLNTHVQTQA